MRSHAITGSSNASAFGATADWSRGEFTVEAALKRSIAERRAELDVLLFETDAAGGGFIIYRYIPLYTVIYRYI